MWLITKSMQHDQVDTFTICPSPPHFEHDVSTENMPLLYDVCQQQFRVLINRNSPYSHIFQTPHISGQQTLPLPLHALQTWGFDPGGKPVPAATPNQTVKHDPSQEDLCTSIYRILNAYCRHCIEQLHWTVYSSCSLLPLPWRRVATVATKFSLYECSEWRITKMGIYGSWNCIGADCLWRALRAAYSQESKAQISPEQMMYAFEYYV